MGPGAPTPAGSCCARKMQRGRQEHRAAKDILRMSPTHALPPAPRIEPSWGSLALPKFLPSPDTDYHLFQLDTPVQAPGA